MKEILFKLLKIRYKVSLSDLYNEVKKIADERNEPYIVVEARMDPEKNIMFKAYINGLTWVESDTIEGICGKLKSYKPESPIENVSII